MAKVTVPRVNGGPGIKSSEVNDLCGLHKNLWTNSTVIDLSGADATINVLAVPTGVTVRIQAVTATYIEAVSDDGDGTIVCGYIDGGTTDVDRFGTMTPTSEAAAGSQQSMTILNDGIAYAGDVITVGHTQKTGAGTAFITVEYTIDDEGY